MKYVRYWILYLGFKVCTIKLKTCFLSKQQWPSGLVITDDWCHRIFFSFLCMEIYIKDSHSYYPNSVFLFFFLCRRYWSYFLLSCYLVTAMNSPWIILELFLWTFFSLFPLNIGQAINFKETELWYLWMDSEFDDSTNAFYFPPILLMLETCV